MRSIERFDKPAIDLMSAPPVTLMINLGGLRFQYDSPKSRFVIFHVSVLCDIRMYFFVQFTCFYIIKSIINFFCYLFYFVVKFLFFCLNVEIYKGKNHVTNFGGFDLFAIEINLAISVRCTIVCCELVVVGIPKFFGRP